MVMVGRMQTLVDWTESSHGLLTLTVPQMLSHSLLVNGMILMKMGLETIGLTVLGTKLE